MPRLSGQLEYMYDLERLGIRLGLEIMQELMEALGHPEEKFQSIHITGTTGKGSAAALTAAALQSGGYNTGLYTSPHLIRFNERIRVSGVEISDAELSTLIGEIREVVEKRELTATFFEFTTALAFLHFARQKIDIAVVEVGMGGDLDATNVIQPLLAAVTNIGRDHTAILGETKEEIATHKAGIFKRGSVAITAESDPTMVELLERKAREKSTEFFRVQDTVQIQSLSASLDYQEFETSGAYQARFTLPLVGNHQLLNAATALTILFHVGKHGFPVEITDIQAAFAHTQWPGRLQVVSTHPLILIDGAHNRDGVNVLHSFLTQELPRIYYDTPMYGDMPRFKVLVLAMKKDKELGTMAELIVPLFEKVIVTEGSYEPWPAQELAQQLAPYHKNVHAVPNVREALAQARAELKKDDLMLVTGSLYMIGEAIDVIATRGYYEGSLVT